MVRNILNRDVITALFLCAYLCGGAKIPQMDLPLVDFGGLTTSDPTTIVVAMNALTTIGALQITDIPQFAQIRAEALSPLAGCLKASQSVDSITQNMPDGSLRLTAVAASVHGRAGVMTSKCGDSAERLRSTVDATTKLLFGALDRSKAFTHKADWSSKAAVMSPYMTYEDVLRNGEHLEHLHTYFSPSSDANVESERTFEYHTDAGLFIAMTTGLYSGEAPSDASGLYIELPTGVRAKAVLRDDALVILVGDGGARWLKSEGVVGSPLRAVPHALVAGLRAGSESTRSWYGKMFLPPGDAVIPEEQRVTFEQYQQRHSRAVAAAKAEGRMSVPESETLPTACGKGAVAVVGGGDRQLQGGVRHRYFHALSTATECTVDGKDGIMCWMRCMSVEDLACGQSAECVDPASGQVVDGSSVTCPSCVPQCVETAEDLETPTMGASTNDYCYGTGVSMIMEGFMSIAYEPKGNTPCINLLFLHWTLDSKLKFGFACIGVMLFGIFVQYLTKLRHLLGKQKVSLENNAKIVVVHAVQIVSGYFIMLVAMTYSIELFSMVCVGLTLGFALFNVKTPGESGDVTLPSDSEASESLVANPIKTSSAPVFAPAPDL